MQQTFTNNDLIKFIYHETSTLEAIAIEEELQENYLLQEEYQTLLKGYRELPKAMFSPSADTLNSVLGYSASTLIEV